MFLTIFEPTNNSCFEHCVRLLCSINDLSSYSRGLVIRIFRFHEFKPCPYFTDFDLHFTDYINYPVSVVSQRLSVFYNVFRIFPLPVGTFSTLSVFSLIWVTHILSLF